MLQRNSRVFSSVGWCRDVLVMTPECLYYFCTLQHFVTNAMNFTILCQQLMSLSNNSTKRVNTQISWYVRTFCVSIDLVSWAKNLFRLEFYFCRTISSFPKINFSFIYVQLTIIKIKYFLSIFRLSFVGRHQIVLSSFLYTRVDSHLTSHRALLSCSVEWRQE